MAEATLKYDPRKALKIGLSLRQIDALLDAFMEFEPFPTGPPWDSIGLHRFQLRWLAREFETAAKEASPELPPHERPKVRNTKTIWCRTEGCKGTLTTAQAKSSHFCSACQKRSAA